MFRHILISKSEFFPAEAELINQLMELGNFNFHLRKKEADEKEVQKLIYKISDKFYSRIVIHQHYSLEKYFSLGGIHLPETERKRYEELKKEGHKIISSSIHQLSDFEALKRNYSYLFYAPLFNSISKPKHTPLLNPHQVQEELKKLKSKSTLIALGGITAENTEDVKAWGFGGAAFLGSVWGNKSPVKYFGEIIGAHNKMH